MASKIAENVLGY